MSILRSTTRASNSVFSAARAFSTTSARPLAKMQLIGRLADQPELVPTSTGREIVKYALGVSSGRKDENGNRPVSWYKVASFEEEGPLRELMLGLPKGTLVYVEADARMDSFAGQDGVRRTNLNLVQRSFETLSRPKFDAAEASANHDDPALEPASGVGAS